MDLIFIPWVHYIPYESHTYEGLKDALKYALLDPNATTIAQAGYDQVVKYHLVQHRVQQIVEVLQDA
jgi:spore maturation protein CgeB